MAGVLMMNDRTIFVRTDGDDANDGYADTPDHAFRTFQAACDAALREAEAAAHVKITLSGAMRKE